MKTLVFTILGIWILRGALEVAIGLFQIIFGLVAGTLGLCLLGLSFVMEILNALWQTAFSIPD